MNNTKVNDNSPFQSKLDQINDIIAKIKEKLENTEKDQSESHNNYIVDYDHSVSIPLRLIVTENPELSPPRGILLLVSSQ